MNKRLCSCGDSEHGGRVTGTDMGKQIQIVEINPSRVSALTVPENGTRIDAGEVETAFKDVIALLKATAARLDAVVAQSYVLQNNVTALQSSLATLSLRVDTLQTGPTAPAAPAVTGAGTTVSSIVVDITPIAVSGTVEYNIYTEYKRSIDTTWTEVGEVNDMPDGGTVQVDVVGLMPGTSYDVRARVKPSSPPGDEYSPWATVTGLVTSAGDPSGGGFNGGSGNYIKPLSRADLPLKSAFRVIPQTQSEQSVFEISAESGTEWEYQLALNNGDSASWTVTDGNLPTWLAMTTGGLLGGTPPADDMNKQFVFTVRAETATAMFTQRFTFRVLSGAESSNAVIIATTYGSVVDVEPSPGAVYGSGNIVFRIDWGDGATGVYETDRMYMTNPDRHVDVVADRVIRHAFSGNFANPSTLKTVRMEILQFQGTDAYFNPKFHSNYFSQSTAARGVKSVDISQNRYSTFVEVYGSLDFVPTGITGEHVGSSEGFFPIYTHARLIANRCTALSFASGWADKFLLPSSLYNNHPTLRIYINLQYCSLTQAQVDAVLSGVNTASPTYSGTNKPVLVLSNNAAPSSTGLAAKAALEGKNWTVVTS